MCEDLLVRHRHHAGLGNFQDRGMVGEDSALNGAGARAQEQGQDRGDRITRARYVVYHARGHSLDNTAER